MGAIDMFNDFVKLIESESHPQGCRPSSCLPEDDHLIDPRVTPEITHRCEKM